jgi:hypothetical protein
MWTYILTDLAGTEIGEVSNATTRSLSLGLNRAATASFTVRQDNPLVGSLFSTDTLLKVYEDTTLRFHGNVITNELSSSGGEAPTIRLNAANPAWRLARRLTGLSPGGKNYTGDRAKSARKMINEANLGTETGPASINNPHTGIKLLSEASYIAGSGTYTAGPYRATLTCINDLAHTLNGFDWYIAPIEGETAVTSNEAGSWTTPLIGLFEANNAYGADKGAVFEYGYGQKNIRTMSYIRDLGDITNKAFHLPNDLSTESVLNEFSVPSINEHGRYETAADAFGITDTGLREAWLDEVIRVRRNPRYVVGMTLDIDDGTGRVPQLGTDFWLGDLATARAVIGGTALFSGKVRVYGVEIEIAESGSSTMTPILLDEEGESL